MKYVLASLLAVGLIGGTQVVTYGESGDTIPTMHANEQGAAGAGQRQGTVGEDENNGTRKTDRVGTASYWNHRPLCPGCEPRTGIRQSQGKKEHGDEKPTTSETKE